MDRDASQEAEIFSAATEIVRDDQGRFAAQTEERTEPSRPERQEDGGQRPAAPEARPDDEQAREGQPQPDGGQGQHQDPRYAGLMRDLQGERTKRQKWESDLAARDRELAETRGMLRQMQEMFGQMRGQGQQPPAPREAPKAPDPFDDPQGFARFQAQQEFEERFGPFAQAYQQRERQFGRTIEGLQRSVAAQIHGADLAREAEEAFNTAAARKTIDLHEYQRIQSADNPFAAVVDWHNRNKVHSQVGNDPEKWFGTEFQRRLREDPAFQKQAIDLLQGQAQAAGAHAPAAGRPAPVFAGLPSLTAAPGTPGRQEAPISEGDIFSAAPPKMGGRR